MDIMFVLMILINLVSGTCSKRWADLESNLTKHDYDEAPWEITKEAVNLEVGLIFTELQSVTITEIQSSFHLVQRWSNPLLKFDPSSISPSKYTLLDQQSHKRVWNPDMYVANAVASTIHSVTQPNSFMRIYPNGTIYKSDRLTVRFVCALSYSSFPHSVQQCSMRLKSYSFTTNQILLDWWKDNTYTSKEFVTAGVKLDSMEQKRCTHNIHGEEQPCLELTLTLKMDFTSYIIRIYLPSTLIVVLGWLSMWLDKAQVGARTSLGVLCVVSVLTQSLGVMVMLPNAEGLLAIDIWMGICMLFATMALFIFALVHNLHRRRNRKPAVQQKYREGTTDEENGKCNNDTPTCEILPATVQNIARVVYPLLFIVFNIVYWSVFVS